MKTKSMIFQQSGRPAVKRRFAKLRKDIVEGTPNEILTLRELNTMNSICNNCHKYDIGEITDGLVWFEFLKEDLTKRKEAYENANSGTNPNDQQTSQ